MTNASRNCPACGEWLLQPVPGGIRVKGVFTMILETGGIVTACANRHCRQTWRVVRAKVGVYTLESYRGPTTRSAEARVAS